MTPPNLTRAQAEERAALLDVSTYDVTIDLTDGAGAPSERTFAVTTTVRFTAAEPGGSTWIEWVGDGITSAIRCILAGGAGSAAPRALGEGIACWA